MNHDELFNRAVDLAKETLLAKGDIGARILAYTAEDKLLYVACPFSSDEAKARIVEYLRVRFLAEDVREYIFISECWFKKIFHGEGRPAGPIRDLADKQEGLLVVQTWIEDREKRTRGRLLEIHRKNGAIQLNSQNWNENDVGGTFANLISREGPDLPDEDRAEIKRVLHSHIPVDWISKNNMEVRYIPN